MNKLLLCTVCVLLFNISHADSFRCGRALVTEGDSSNALIKKCGNPERKYSSKAMVKSNGRKTRVGVSNWVYPRTRKRDMIVSVHSGVVVRIKVD